MRFRGKTVPADYPVSGDEEARRRFEEDVRNRERAAVWRLKKIKRATEGQSK